MTDEQNDETVLPINEQQRTFCYNEICDAIENLTQRLSRLADFAEMVGQPQPDQLRELQRNTIRCVHAFADATHQLARHRRRRTRAHMILTNETNLKHDAVRKPTTTHPSAGTINKDLRHVLNPTPTDHDTNKPNQTPQNRWTHNK